MNPFDPKAFPEGREEQVKSYDAMVKARADFSFEVDRSEVDLPVEESVLHGFGDKDLDGELIDFVLEFALSRDGVIIAGGAIPTTCPDACPAWAWQAFLEGVILSARGTAALVVAKSANGFEAEDLEEWEEDEDEEVLLDNNVAEEGPEAAPAPDLPF